MTTHSQTDIISTFTSVDGDKSISISQLGLTLKRNILTTPIETIITPLDITDVNTGNSITMNRLTFLPIGLAALEAPPNATTIKVVDTIFIDGTGLLGNDTNTVNNSSMSIFNIDTGNTYNIGKNSNDLVIDAGGDRLLLNANNNEFYIGEYNTGTAPVINSSGSSTKTLNLNSRDGITKIGDTDNNHFSTRILVDDTAANMELNSLGTITIGDCALSSGQQYINLDTNNATVTINAPGGCNVKDTILINKTGDLNSTTVDFDSIVLTDGTTTNTINKNGYTTRNSVQNSTHYLNFSDNSATGTGAIQKTAGISCNPATNIITATTFVGASTNLVVTSDNTNGTYYIPFVKTSGTGDKSVYMDDAIGPLTYNPNTATLSTSAFSISSTPATANVASRFGQVGLVKLQTINTTITGAALPLTFSLSNIFTSAYKNYRIILQPRSDVTFTAYPAYNLSAFLGTGTLPTTANLYGYEMTSSSANLQSLFTTGIVIASTPVIFAVTGLTNKVVSFDITNVGYTTASATVVNMNCKSFYNNPGVNGVSDRNISFAATSGSTITGLTLQQTSIGVGNNFDLSAIIYGYNQL